MSRPIFKAMIRATGEVVEVYQRTRGGYILWPTCDNIFRPQDLEIIGIKEGAKAETIKGQPTNNKKG